jgi:hypothetical protein
VVERKFDRSVVLERFAAIVEQRAGVDDRVLVDVTSG